jgi:hypothetical protein
MYIAQRSERDRSKFVKKVLGILGCQFLFTFYGVIVAQDGSWRLQYAQMFYIIAALCCVPMIGIPIAMACCNVGRRHPFNWICLTIYTVCSTAVFVFLSLWFSGSSMYLFFGTGCGIAFSLMGYFQAYDPVWDHPGRDFTGSGPYRFVIGMGILIFCVLLVFLGCPGQGVPDLSGCEVQWLSVALNLVLIIPFSCYIVYYLQLVVDGKHKKHQFEVEDHCFAALLLYAEPIENILRLFCETR